MALCHNCDDTRIEYIGNGSQADYTFPFEYNERQDVAVAYWNEDYLVWEPITTGWDFLNDTTLRFDVAPENDQKLIIYRCTDLTPMPAEFYPGTAIKAQDLNDNFFVLKSAIEEARCAIARQDEKAEEKYWNKIEYEEFTQMPTPDTGETVTSKIRWVSVDEAVATTAAIDQFVENELEILKVDLQDTRGGRWSIIDGDKNTDEYIPTAAASSEKYDPFFQDTLPPTFNNWRMPGKLWFDSDEVNTRLWDETAGTWVASGLQGPPGPTGPTGTYSTIVSPTAPLRRIDNTELKNGDVWFNSSSGSLFVWYDDGQPQGRSKQWVQAVAGAGPQGPPGPPGTGAYTFTQPIVENGDVVSFDINLLTNLP
jgi:hypothetical protein